MKKKLFVFGAPLVLLLMAIAMMTVSVSAEPSLQKSDWRKVFANVSESHAARLDQEVKVGSSGELMWANASDPVHADVVVPLLSGCIRQGEDGAPPEVCAGVPAGTNKWISGFTVWPAELPTPVPTATAVPPTATPVPTPTPEWMSGIRPVSETITLDTEVCEPENSAIVCIHWDIARGYWQQGNQEKQIGIPVTMTVTQSMNGSWIDENAVEHYGLEPGIWLVSGFTYKRELPTATPTSTPTLEPTATSQPTATAQPSITPTPVIPDRYKLIVDGDTVFISFFIGEVSGVISWGESSGDVSFATNTISHTYQNTGEYTVTAVFTDDIGIGQISSKVSVEVPMEFREIWYDWIEPIDGSIKLNWQVCEGEENVPYQCVHWDLAKGYTLNGEVVTGKPVEMDVFVPMDGSFVDSVGVEHPGLLPGKKLVSGFTFRREWSNFLPAVRK